MWLRDDDDYKKAMMMMMMMTMMICVVLLIYKNKSFNSFRGLFDVYSFPGIVLAQIADDVPHVRLVQDREIARGLGEQSAFDWSTILSPFSQIVSVGLD